MQYSKSQEINSGDTRQVFSVPDSEHNYRTSAVLKTGKIGINYREIEAWNYAKSNPELKSEFAEIYDYADDYSWILMERVRMPQGNVEDIDDNLLRNNGYNVGVIKDENVGSLKEDIASW